MKSAKKKKTSDNNNNNNKQKETEMNIKTTDKGAEIIELIQFIIDDRNRILENLYLLDEREARNGSLTLVEDFLRHHYRRSLVRCDDHIETLRNALDREHLSMAEALGVW